MALFKLLHAVALILLALFGLLIARSMQGAALLYWTLWATYAAFWGGLLLNNIWCARLLALPPLLITFVAAPNVLYNFYGFVSGDARYLDSPAAIFVVAVEAIFTTVPSLLVLMGYWVGRHQIFTTRL